MGYFSRVFCAVFAVHAVACVEGAEVVDASNHSDVRRVDATRDSYVPPLDVPTDRPLAVDSPMPEASVDVVSRMDVINDTGAPVCGLRNRPCCMDGSCEGGTACVMGMCTLCGSRTQPCCAGSMCSAGSCVMGTCVDPMMLCGQATQPCCDGVRCIAPATCESGVCRAGAICGALAQSCCMGTTCNAGLRCTMGICRMICGGNGEPCCGAGACNAGYTCMSGLCSNNAMMGGCGARLQACCAGRVCNAGLMCNAGGVCQ